MYAGNLALHAPLDQRPAPKAHKKTRPRKISGFPRKRFALGKGDEWSGGAFLARFDRYLLSRYLMFFGFFTLVLVAVYWVNRAVLLLSKLIADGQSARLFLEMSALIVPSVILELAPAATYVAAAYATNRLAADSELVVMQATGFSPWRLARPALVFGLIVTGFMLVLSNYLVPMSRGAISDRANLIAENIAGQFLREGVFQHPAPGVTFYIRKIDERGELREVFLNDARDAAQTHTFTARRALFLRTEKGPRLVLFEGMIQSVEIETQRLAVTRFDDLSYDLTELLGPATTRPVDAYSLPTSQLLDPSEALLAESRQARARLIYEAHMRLAQPFLAVAGALIGFSTLLLGGFSRFGLWKQILGGAALLVAVQLTTNFAASIGMSNSSFWPIVWLAPIGGTASALVLLAIAAKPHRKPAEARS